MNEYLVALEYHYPETYDLWTKGIGEDFEAATGLFVAADTPQRALEWGAVVATRLLNHVHGTDNLTLEQFQHLCSIEESPTTCGWSHCLSFFQHVAFGEMPDLDRMTSDAYAKWRENNA